MSHSKKHLHEPTIDDTPSEQESDKQFFLILGVMVIALAIGLMSYYLFNAAFSGSGNVAESDTRVTAQSNSSEEYTKKVDSALQNFSFSQNEKVPLVVGFTTPNSSDVLDELQRDEYTITRFYWNQPVFGVEVTESGYQKLMNSSHVNEIKLDRER
jgi:hypothetical protein